MIELLCMQKVQGSVSGISRQKREKLLCFFQVASPAQTALFHFPFGGACYSKPHNIVEFFGGWGIIRSCIKTACLLKMRMLCPDSDNIVMHKHVPAHFKMATE